MDLFAHALYGATLCSRSGLAGGRGGRPGVRWHRDATIWWSVFFGLLPDMLSMWAPFVMHRFSGLSGNFFVHFDGHWIEVYRLAHSALVALAVTALLVVARRGLWIPSLAWTVHIVCDAVSHGEGKFQTLPFYPLSDWGIAGIPFWRHPEFVLAYWVLLVALWVAIAWWRRAGRSNPAPAKKHRLPK